MVLKLAEPTIAVIQAGTRTEIDQAAALEVQRVWAELVLV